MPLSPQPCLRASLLAPPNVLHLSDALVGYHIGSSKIVIIMVFQIPNPRSWYDCANMSESDQEAADSCDELTREQLPTASRLSAIPGQTTSIPDCARSLGYSWILVNNVELSSLVY